MKIYWIKKDGLNYLPNNTIKEDNNITIWDNDNNSPITKNGNHWIIEDVNKYAPFKQSNENDADFVFIVDGEKAYFYTWDKNKTPTTLRIVANFGITNTLQPPENWTVMDENNINILLNQYDGAKEEIKSWKKIQIKNPSKLGEEFIIRAISYEVTEKILQKIITSSNNVRNPNIIPNGDWGQLKINGNRFCIGGSWYSFNDRTGNGGLGLLIKHINDDRRGYGKYFHANLSYEKNVLKYNFYINPMMSTIQYKGILEKNHNIILNGAPGTGKTYLAHEIAAVMLGKNTWKDVENDTTNLASHVGFVQFHPSYDYTDFVEGLRPTIQGNTPFELLPGIFKTFCEEALKNGYKNKEKYEKNEDGVLVAQGNQLPYIFIIDEINRGEMSKIFGELFFSIDPGYRGKKGKVQTQYANMEKSGNEFDKALANKKNGQFFVPENVYIIGTMNDIDRSVESMDFAMRRRFKFVEILASKQDGMLKKEFGNDADKVIRRMNNLNLAIQETEGLGSEYHIGPSYFLKLEQPIDRNSFERLWNGYLEGIIFEYLRGREDTNEALECIKKVYLTDKTEFFDLEPKSGKLSVKNSSDWSKVFNND